MTQNFKLNRHYLLLMCMEGKRRWSRTLMSPLCCEARLPVLTATTTNRGFRHLCLMSQIRISQGRWSHPAGLAWLHTVLFSIVSSQAAAKCTHPSICMEMSREGMKQCSVFVGVGSFALSFNVGHCVRRFVFFCVSIQQLASLQNLSWARRQPFWYTAYSPLNFCCPI